eukprot:TRINITY_DN54722_c0_g1_i1.p1 TRINITY_DN54722_c0_g1~~TRINITY_DN54722_c0_g1_i1.p1  ORF type:complete len:343 (-),score=49.70 TRINITY_DN54722_c0_g1_i1:446-1453(-)
MMLSRESAVGLSDELGEIAKCLRGLEVKYNLLEQPAPWYELPERLLSSLRPFADDPKVAAIASYFGLGLSSPSSDSAPSLRTEAPVASPPPSKLNPVLLGSIGNGMRRGRKLNVPGASEAKGAPTFGASDTTRTPVTLRSFLKPRFVQCSRASSFTFTSEKDAKVIDVRKQLSAVLSRPLSRVWLVAEWPSDAKGVTKLDDGAPAALASHVYVTNMTYSESSFPCGASLGQFAFDREQVLSLLSALSEGLDAECASRGSQAAISADALRTVQARVLPKYGLQADSSGVARLLETLDGLLMLGDDDVMQRADAINQRAGLLPQVFVLECTEPSCSL